LYLIRPSLSLLFFLLTTRPPLRPPLFPYTTLFRSQQLIHRAHPRLAQIRHFFGEKCLPQARLLMLHSDHGMKTIQNRIRLFCLGLHLAVPTIPCENDLISHRKVASQCASKSTLRVSFSNVSAVDLTAAAISLPSGAR